jgi:hypothetical protein
MEILIFTFGWGLEKVQNQLVVHTHHWSITIRMLMGNNLHEQIIK